jgi:hypothetical protein
LFGDSASLNSVGEECTGRRRHYLLTFAIGVADEREERGEKRRSGDNRLKS